MSSRGLQSKDLEALLEDGKPEDIARLLKLLQKVWVESQRDVSKKWKRTLPFGDYIVDRWDKANALGFGEGASIYDSALVFGNVSVGKNTWIGPNVILDGVGGLSIGDNCSISAGVQIYSHDSVDWATSGGKAEIIQAATSVGSRCYIGPNSIITKGVTIGTGCVIGAMSLVLKDIPAGAKAFGVPAKITI